MSLETRLTKLERALPKAETCQEAAKRIQAIDYDAILREQQEYLASLPDDWTWEQIADDMMRRLFGETP